MKIGNRNFFLISIIFWKVFALVYTYFIFSSFTSLGDIGSYLNPNLEALYRNTLFNIYTSRQLYIKGFYSLPALIEISPYIFLFLFPLLHIIIYYLIFHKIYSHINKLLFWILMFSPSTLAWTSVIGKEIVYIPLYLILINLFLIYFFKDKIYLISIFILLSFLFWVRMPYTIPYIFLFFGIIFYKLYLRPNSIFKLNTTIFFIILFILSVIVTYIFFSNYNSFINLIEHYMYIVRRLFIHNISHSENIRYNIEFFQISDLFKNLLWGIPISLIGPDFNEISKSPFKAAFFIDALISIVIFFYLISTILSKNINHFSKFIIFIYIPSVILILLFHYPFGIFNSGTALRWKQSLLPLFIYFPLMFLAYSSKNEKEN